MEMTPEFKVTIITALVGGITTARERNEELRPQLNLAERFGAVKNVVRIKQEIEIMEEWMVELADTLHWLNGTQYEEMKALHKVIQSKGAVPIDIGKDRRKGERRHV